MRSFTGFLAITLLIFATACYQENEGIRDGHARLNVSIIDAPADYDEVWVEVLAVEILPGNREESDASAWISIPHDSENKKINLLELVGQNEAFVGSREVPAGKISQIRLILGEDNYIIQNGNRLDLKTPSAQQSGLKLKVNKELMAGIQYDLVIDFDAAKSIVRAGNSGMYILKPVLRVIADESASISGTILPLETAPVISGVIGMDTVNTFTDENGYFLLRGLKEGDYRLIIAPEVGYDTLIIDPVPAVKGQVTDLNVLELEETEE